MRVRLATSSTALAAAAILLQPAALSAAHPGTRIARAAQQADHVFVVDTTVDLHDATPGDGLCQTSEQTCSLRAAIEENNAASPEPTTIRVPAGHYLLTAGTTRAEVELAITAPVTIEGAGARSTIVDAQQRGRVFAIQTFVPVHITDLSVVGGLCGSEAPDDRCTGASPNFIDGGGIANGGDLTLARVTVADNAAFIGGGLASGGRLLVEDSTLTRNTATGGIGGAIGAGGEMRIVNSTISGNTSGVAEDGGTSFTIDYTTITDSILGASPTNSVTTDAGVAPLRDNGGPTDTRALLPGSPYLDAGDPATCPATDQRGVARPQDGNNDGVAACDAGAYELSPTPPNRPPDCSAATATPNRLWRPNHRFTLVRVGSVSDPDDDVVTLTITGVTQDEPVLGAGSGRAAPDATNGQDSSSVLLRAERSGTGDGRVYAISFTASDGKGGTCQGVVRVGVPHDPAHPSPVDSGQHYNSFATH